MSAKLTPADWGRIRVALRGEINAEASNRRDPSNHFFRDCVDASKKREAAYRSTLAKIRHAGRK